MPSDSPIEVLLIEDNTIDVALARKLLDGTGLQYKLNVARDGDEGMMFLNRDGPFWNAETPDLVLIDLKLPKLSGLALLEDVRRLRSMGRRIGTVAVLSQSTDAKDQSAAATLGADAYFVKPTDPSEYQTLTRAIRELLEEAIGPIN